MTDSRERPEGAGSRKQGPPPSPAVNATAKLESALRGRGVLSTAAFSVAQDARLPDESLGQTLLRLGLVEAQDLSAEQLALGHSREIEALQVDPEVLQGLNPAYLAEHRVFPLYREGQKLHFVSCGRPAPPVLDFLQQVTNTVSARGAEVPPERFAKLFRRHFPKVKLPAARPAAPAPPSAAPAPISSPWAQAQVAADDQKQDPVIVKTVNGILRDAVKYRATDIHLEPAADCLRVRYRVDGGLVERVRLPDAYARGVANRIKALGGLKSHVNFMPQSGRLSLLVDGQPHELRVSILPSVYGEAVVLRVLPQGRAVATLEERGMSGELLERFSALLSRSSGMILVTGPTGSGKSATLFSALNAINTPDIKVITLEDPVEYRLECAIQSSIEPARGYGFTDGLREILRHDPDVVLVGEVRDRETAEIAVQSSLTGHLVLSSLHTIDAPSAITRLVDIGIPIYQIEGGLLGVLAQRLVRRVCAQCRELVRVEEEAVRRYGFEVAAGEYELARAVGCDACNRTGYRGRIGIYELMVMTEEARALLRGGAGIAELREVAVRDGMVPLVQAGLARALEGITTLEEIVGTCS